MNFDERNHEIGDVEMDAALKNFRESVHGWSEQEFSKTRVVRRSRWDAMWRTIASPAIGWTAACALLVASMGGSLAVHHQRQVAINRDLATKQQIEQEKLDVATAATANQADAAMNDDELLSHVDSDIAQAAPDAMQPLASMMSDAAMTGTTK